MVRIVARVNEHSVIGEDRGEDRGEEIVVRIVVRIVATSNRLCGYVLCAAALYDRI